MITFFYFYQYILSRLNGLSLLPNKLFDNDTDTITVTLNKYITPVEAGLGVGDWRGV